MPKPLVVSPKNSMLGVAGLYSKLNQNTDPGVPSVVESVRVGFDVAVEAIDSAPAPAWSGALAGVTVSVISVVPVVLAVHGPVKPLSAVPSNPLKLPEVPENPSFAINPALESVYVH